MKICYIADARSPIAQSWIQYFADQRYDIHVISTYPIETVKMAANVRLYEETLGHARLSQFNHDGTIGQTKKRSALTPILANLRSGAFSNVVMTAMRWIVPLEVMSHVGTMKHLIQIINPDLIHALRIPYEGIVASHAAPKDIPLVISVWGNDFTLFAKHSPLLAKQTRYAMRRTNALIADCQRDIALSKQYGFDAVQKPTRVLPGGGGICSKQFFPGAPNPDHQTALNIPPDAPVVINSRGIRDYIRNDIFFNALPQVLEKHPNTIFIGVGMKGNPTIESMIDKLGIVASVRLTNKVPHHDMGEMFRLAQITVSPSLHDGTPNTLIEAMASGCFPVVSDIETMHEWIVHGKNGLLFEPTSVNELVTHLCTAIENNHLRETARSKNLALIKERVEHELVMKQAEEFYQTLITNELAGSR